MTAAIIVFTLAAYSALVVFCEDLKDDTVQHADGTTSFFRSRRAIVADEALRWTKGVIPYTLTSSITPDALQEIKRGMATYERFTCLKFVPWTENTNTELGLGHDGHLNFHKDQRCHAELGNKRRSSGQFISCCDETRCIHELGHAIGFIHEHQSPTRSGWIRVNEENVDPASLQWYLKYEDSEVITDGFDIQSVMIYPPEANQAPSKGNAYTYLWPELHYGENFYYLFKEIAHVYKCAETHCADFGMTCENDGFVTVVDGKCSCLCPEGLDPATGCVEIMREVPEGTEFPGGSWALPMTKDGCPSDDFQTGSRKHFTDKDGPNEKSPSYHLSGFITNYSAEHSFCINNGTIGDPDTFWGDGNYCVYAAGGRCPGHKNGETGAGFQTGHIDFWDRKDYKNVNTRSGALPDGRFDAKATCFEFCCRDSGFSKLPLYLPNRQPLALFMPQYTFECQKIFGMHATEEWVGLNSLNFRQATYYGKTPYMKVTRHLRRQYIKHCYYEPANTDCGSDVYLDEDFPEYSWTPEPGDHMDCHWLISAPEGNRIKLDLEDMDVKGEMPDNCVDYVSVRAVRLGQTGLKYCGKSTGLSIISHFNSMMINFVTFRQSNSSFNISVTLIPDEDLCYNREDKGVSYVGHVNFTRTFEPCLPWKSVRHCVHHSQNHEFLKKFIHGFGRRKHFKRFRDDLKNLESNYCRNPGDGHQPWCYTDAEKCLRDYCDVCQIGTRFDRLGSAECTSFRAKGLCQHDPNALQKCALTCEEPMPQDRGFSYAMVMCMFPPELPDGTLTTAPSDTYNLGDVLTFRCNKPQSNSTVDITCQSDGLWSSVTSACSDCDLGWTHYGGNCFKHFEQKLTHTEAQEMCADHGGDLAMAKDSAANTFIGTLRHYGTPTWIGGLSPMDTKDWMWEDKTAFTWRNWRERYPELTIFPVQCLVLESNGEWTDGHCDFRQERFICQKKSYNV